MQLTRCRLHLAPGLRHEAQIVLDALDAGHGLCQTLSKSAVTGLADFAV